MNKSATKEEIKKAYRKKAMKYHPDRNKWDKTAEKNFKEINSASDDLWDSKKKQQYDTFWSAGWNQFGWWAWWGYSSQWFWGFEDMFGWSWRQSSAWFDFNIEDLFGGQQGSRQQTQKKKPESLDFEKVYEGPDFDLILWCKIEVKWVYWQTAKLKIPASTKPWAKFRVKWFWKKEWLKW